MMAEMTCFCSGFLARARVLHTFESTVKVAETLSLALRAYGLGFILGILLVTCFSVDFTGLGGNFVEGFRSTAW